MQYTDMDFRSRENSRVNSFRMSCLKTCRVQAGQGMKDRVGNSCLLLTSHSGEDSCSCGLYYLYSSDSGIQGSHLLLPKCVRFPTGSLGLHLAFPFPLLHRLVLEGF